jgi:hypothetical protein
MNEQQAIDLVRDTFEAPFEKVDFVRFVKNLLNHVDDDGFPPRGGNYIPDKFEQYINSLERIGTYSDGENRIDILIVHLKKETSIERARSMQRNFVAGYLQGSYGSSAEKEAALVAFVSPSSEDWRFSLVKMEYRFDEKDGQVRVKEEFTPARRWSFLVGAHEKSHTAQRQLVPIVKNIEEDPTLADLEKAFNIETVSDEFFLEYRSLFIQTKQALDQVLEADAETRAEFTAKGINTVDFAKKLLGQIIFLYYLQKKGWFGVPRKDEWGTGSKDFLRELFEKQHGGNQNFFNDILEPLFYDALRNDRSHDDHYYPLFNCKIPFLNGGLFDPIGNYDWVNTEIALPNALFFNQKKTKQSDTGDGILNIFDHYNFTVREDEPYEKEVAIDPELLGKAYEKFNAIRPDNFDEYLRAVQSGKKGNETKFNKQYGVYYTPREIVHYMCQLSLIQYLHTALNSEKSTQVFSQDDLEKLILHGERIKEHDARVIAAGRETHTYPFIMPPAIRSNAALFDKKLAAITVCDPAVGSGAFPVGMMTEIVKARDVLETYTQSDQSVYNFKRACIEHSLYGVDIDPGAVEIAKLRLWLSLVVDEEDIHHIKPLPNLDYKIVCGNSLIELVSAEFLAGTADQERNALVAQLKEAKDELFNITHPGQKEQKRAQTENLIQQLFEHYKAAEIRKLEVKIHAIRGQQGLFADAKLTKADQKKLQTWEVEIRRLDSLQLPGPAEHFEWRINFSEVFQDKGGFDIVIGNPPYNAELTNKERKFFKENFKSVSSGRQDTCAIFIERANQISNKLGSLSFILPYRLFSRKRNHGQLQIWMLNHYALKEVIYLGSDIGFSANDEFMIVLANLLSPNNNSIQVAIKPSMFNLANGKLAFQSIDQSIYIDNQEINLNLLRYDKKFLDKISHDTQPLKAICNVRDGIVPYLRDKLVSTRKLDSRYVKFAGIAGKYTLDRYYFDSDPLWLCYDLKEAKKYIKDKVELRKVQLREKDIFLSRKIITSQNSATLKGTIDEDQIFVSNSIHSTYLNQENADKFYLEFILGMINSNLINYYHDSLRVKATDLHPQILIGHLKVLPIKEVYLTQQEPIVEIVNRILTAKNANPQADTSVLENEINQLVYQLYGLTEEEIAIVDGATRA